MNHHRTWLPVIIVGLIIVALIAWRAWGAEIQKRLPDATKTQQQVQNIVTNASYAQELFAALTDFAKNHDRAIFMDKLTTMRVPADFRDLHVKLVIAADDVDYSADNLNAVIAEAQQKLEQITKSK